MGDEERAVDLLRAFDEIAECDPSLLGFQSLERVDVDSSADDFVALTGDVGGDPDAPFPATSHIAIGRYGDVVVGILQGGALPGGVANTVTAEQVVAWVEAIAAAR